jgi:hypothetical protein
VLPVLVVYKEPAAGQRSQSDVFAPIGVLEIVLHQVPALYCLPSQGTGDV